MTENWRVVSREGRAMSLRVFFEGNRYCRFAKLFLPALNMPGGLLDGHVA